nr:MAG TPA: hypothetical protein [Caudoviricetes sp.]
MFVVFHTTNTNRLFLHRKRLLFVSHKDSTFDVLMMIYYTTLLPALLSSLLKLLQAKSLHFPVSRKALTQFSVSRQG